MDKENEEVIPTPEVRKTDRAASGAPKSGWAISDRFSWEEINQRVLASADEEITSRPKELFFSGLTAGFAIVLTLIGYARGSAAFPDNQYLAALLYPIGFMYIILGRYQLYTENTLPPVKLVLSRLASLPLLLRLWLIVLCANLTGAALGTLLVSKTQVLSPESKLAAIHFIKHVTVLSRWDIFCRALFAGWLVAGVVWISTAARDTISRLIIVYFVFYTIAVCNLFHVVTTASEVFMLMFSGSSPHSLGEMLTNFWLPVLAGNTAGGVLAFTGLSYAQTEYKYYPEIRLLSIKDVLFTMKGGRPHKTPRPRPAWKEQQEG